MSGKRIVIMKLLASLPVTALVGNRILPSHADSGSTSPRYIIVSKPGENNRQLLVADAGFPQTRIRIECFAETATIAEDIRRAAFDALKNVTNEAFVAGSFSAVATITPTSFSLDGYSDLRESDVEIFDVYVDWRFA